MSEAAAEFGDGGVQVDAGDGGESWSGPSESDWQEPEAPEFDPFADDVADQVRAIAREEFAPFDAWMAQEQERAALEAGVEQVEGMIGAHAAALGAELSAEQAAQVEQQAWVVVEGVAAELLRGVGYTPEQAEELIRSSSPGETLLAVARAQGMTEAEFADKVLELLVGAHHAAANPARSPHEVLRRSFRTQPASQRSRPASRGPYGVLEKHRKLNEGRRS